MKTEQKIGLTHFSGYMWQLFFLFFTKMSVPFFVALLGN